MLFTIRIIAMEVIAGLLIALAARPCSADEVNLKTPVSLAVLAADLYYLEKTFSSSGSWLDSRLIQYNDQIKFFVRLYRHSAVGKTIFEVDGKLMVAGAKQLGGEIRKIQTLLFHSGLFYFDDPTNKPVQHPEDYYIVHYVPPEGNTDQSPVIEYMSKEQFENQLKGSIETIFYEEILSGAVAMNTYFFMNGGAKVHANVYEEDHRTIFFEADFRFVYSTGETDFIEKSERLHTLAYDSITKSFPKISSLGRVYGVRVAPPFKQKRTDSTADVIKISRQHLLRDIQQSKPTYEMSLMNVSGMIKYDKSRIFTSTYIETNGKIALRFVGRFVTEDGDSLCCICVATPGHLPGTGNLISESTVLFSCSPDSTMVQILLRDDTEYIEMEAGYNVVLTFQKRFLKKPAYRIEPYLEYITYELFLQTLRIVSDLMRIRCANRFHRRSYRLFANVFLVYDCNTGIAWFDKLDLWLKDDQQKSLVKENVAGVTYDSNTERLLLDNKPLTFFRLRQLHSIFPSKIPIEMQHMYALCYGKTDVAVDLKSVEWDMQNMRQGILKTILPQTTSFVCVDDGELFYGQKSLATIDGEMKPVVVIKGVSSSCTPEGCVGNYDILYDGSKMITRNSHGLDLKEVPAVYVPKTSKLSFIEDMLCQGQERYVALSTFREDMRELSELMHKRCEELRGNPDYDDKLTIYIHYFRSRNPIVGYYDCTLQYIFFFSDFKVIKHPSVPRGPSSYRLGEELKIIPNSVEEVDNLNLLDSAETLDDQEERILRRKYSDFIIRDLFYDQKEKLFHSRSMFLSEVFALRLLPRKTEAEAESSAIGGLKLKLKGGAQVVVYGLNAPKIAWM